MADTDLAVRISTLALALIEQQEHGMLCPQTMKELERIGKLV